jgi:RNA polymerase sigma-70 factor (ECF subfamily)
MEESDEILIEAINNGSSEAFEKLYFRYRDWVYRLAWRFTRKDDIALDCLQETFAYILRKTPSLKLTAKMTTFLYPVVLHLSMAVLNKKTPSSLEEAVDEPVYQAKESLFDKQTDLAMVLSTLVPKHREVLLMKYFDGLTIEEISQALNIPIGTVKSRINKALRTLREDNRTKKYFLE